MRVEFYFAKKCTSWTLRRKGEKFCFSIPCFCLSFLSLSKKSFPMSQEESHFVHWKGSPDIAPFLDYLPEFGILKFSGIRPHSLDMHYHEGIEFHYVVKGTYQWKVEDSCFQLFPGQGFITCPWERHGNQDSVLQRGVLAWMIIRPESFTPDGHLDLGSWSSLSKETQRAIGRSFVNNTNPVIPRGPDLINTFRQLNYELVTKQIGYQEKVNSLLDGLITNMARVLEKRQGGDEPDEDFLAKLNQRLNESIFRKTSMDELAYSFGMSVSTFIKKVKFLTGFSPVDYFTEIKLGKAKELLTHTDKTITVISAECGFYSSQYFARIFSRRLGMNPTLFRKKTQSLP